MFNIHMEHENVTARKGRAAFSLVPGRLSCLFYKVNKPSPLSGHESDSTHKPDT